MTSAPHPNRRRLTGQGLVKWAVLIGALLWLAGLFWFVDHLPLPTRELATPTDGIVVLTGGAARIEGGLSLLKAHHDSRLLISGVDARIDRKTLRATLRNNLDAFDCCVDLGTTATDTVENAREISQWAEEQDFRSLTVVTANYHMPRSILEIQRTAPDLVLVAYPVRSANVPLDGWWRRPRTVVLIGSEYTKYLLSFVALSIPSPPTKRSDG